MACKQQTVPTKQQLQYCFQILSSERRQQQNKRFPDNTEKIQCKNQDVN